MDFYSLTPEEFELLCYEYSQKLFECDHYNLEHTKYIHDGGRDIEIQFYDTISNFVIWAECKRHERNIGLDVIGKNVVLVIANRVHKIIFFSVSDITEDAQITISNVSNTFNFEVSYIYGNILKEEIQKYPDIMNKYFPGDMTIFEPEKKITFYISVSEYKNSYIQNSEKKALVILREGNFVYLYAHIKNITANNLWNLRVSLCDPSEDILFSKKVLDIPYLSGKSDLILEFEGRIQNKKASFLELPDVLLQYTYSRQSEDFVYETKQLPKLDITKCKNYPLIGKKVHEYLSRDIMTAQENALEYYPSILDIRGYSGVGKSRIALETKKNVISNGFAVYQYDCKELFDYDLIRNLFCSLLGLPILKGNIQFSKNDIQKLISLCGGSEDFTQILSSFLVDNKLEQRDYYYLLDAMLYFLIHPISKKPLYIIIDNIQNLSIAVLKFIMRVIDLITGQHAQIMLALISNLEAIPSSTKECFNSYLEYMDCKKNVYKKQLFPFLCEPFSDTDAKLFLMTVLNIKNQNHDIIKKFLKKSGYTPFEMTMMLEYLNDNLIIHWISNQQWYIEDTSKMKLFLDKCPQYTVAILNRRLKAIELNKEQKKKFRELVSSLIYFQGCLPYEYLDFAEIDLDFLEYLNESLWISIHPKEGIRFFHDNIHRFFQEKPLYFHNRTVGEQVLNWLETEAQDTFQNKEKIIFYCYFYLTNEEKLKKCGYAYLKKCIQEMNFSEAVEIGELLYPNEKIKKDVLFHTIVGLDFAYCLLRNGNTVKGSDIFDKEIPIALEYQSELDTAFVCTRIHNGINSFIQSCCCKEALKMLGYMSKINRLDDTYRIIMTNRYGISYLHSGDFQKSILYLQEAYRQAQELGQDFWISATLGDLGLYYFYNGEIPLSQRLEKIRYYYEKAISKYNIELDNTNYRRASVYLIEIILDILNGSYISAKGKADSGIDECNRIGQHYTLFRIMTVKALAAIYNKELDLAEQILIDCLHMCELSDLYLGRFISYNNLGVIYFLQHQYKTSQKYFEISYSLIKNRQFNIRHLSIHANRLLIYKMLGEDNKYQKASKICDKLASTSLIHYRSCIKRNHFSQEKTISIWEINGANFAL